MGKARRWYELELPDGVPIHLEDFGNLFKLSGAFYEGIGGKILLRLPNANTPENCHPQDFIIKTLTLPELSEVIRQTDDPKYFELDETGSIKAIHRKCRMAISGAIQQKIWVRDGLKCIFCKRSIGVVQLTVDHWIPLELGGENNAANYVTACRKCNKRKGNIHPKDFCEQNGYDFTALNDYVLNAPEIR